MPFDLKMPSPIKQSVTIKSAAIVEAEPDAQTRNTSHRETLSDNSTPCPHQRACESEPLYNWRTDPYYNEESIRERLKAAKAKILPVSVNDTKNK